MDPVRSNGKRPQTFVSDREPSAESFRVPTISCDSTPYPSSSQLQPTPASSGVSFIDSFFARTPAVALPPAPPQRARRGTLTLDPTDTTIYPSMLFAGGFKHLEERGPAFGLVSVPKLQCCAGKCGCPDGSCGCDHSCGGCAGDLDEEDRAQTDSPINSAMSPMSGNSRSHVPVGIRSCCSSKK